MFHYYPPIHAYSSYCLLPWRLLTRSSIHSLSPPTSDTHRATCKKMYKILRISCPMYPFIYYPYHTKYIINTAYFMYNPLLPSNEVFRCFPSCHLYSYRDQFHLIVAYLRSFQHFFLMISAPSAMSRRLALFWNFTQRKNGRSVATFRDNQSVPSSRDKQSAWPLKMGLISCP
jgi:hypothetical protein